jgi:hypothetical protein
VALDGVLPVLLALALAMRAVLAVHWQRVWVVDDQWRLCQQCTFDPLLLL